VKTEIITIGDEILIGQISDTNGPFLASELSKNGFDVCRMNSLKDDVNEIVQSLNESAQRSDLVFITGGLGPTKDDVTRKAITRYFDCQWEENTAVLERIREFFSVRGYSLTPLNREQAQVPEGSSIFMNPVGTAPGIWLTRGDTHFIFMPGVPFEMQQLIKDHILPELKDRFISSHHIHRNIATQGLPESYLADRLKNWQDNLPDNTTLAFLPAPGIIYLRLTASGNDPEILEQLLDENIKRLKKIIPDHLVHVGDETLEQLIAAYLVSRGQTLSIAESCTGGNISARIISVPGSSRYFKGSVIAYTNAVKQELLGVTSSSLASHGSVSQKVVEEMARGILDLYQSDFAVAVSGIAGPDGGTESKPVGLTWIAVANQDKIISRKFLFGTVRSVNIQKAANTALNLLREIILMGSAEKNDKIV